MDRRRHRWSRRELLGRAIIAAATALLAGRPRVAAVEPPPETTTLRLAWTRGLCLAPLHLAEDLLQGEGFSDVRHVMLVGRTADALASDRVDIGIDFIGPLAIQVDAGAPVLVLGGAHVGCHEVFGSAHVRSLADLRGRTVAVPALGSGQHVFLATMLTASGLHPRDDIHWVSRPPAEAMRLLAEGHVDAVPTFPPDAQEFRARRIGRVIVNTATDPPWSRYFCCMVAGNRDFVQQHPMATKRALRAVLKSASVCALEPERAASALVDKGSPLSYELIVQVLKELAYDKWREYDPEDTVRFYALHLRQAGFVTRSPQEMIAEGTDWRFLNELKKELKG
jgi:NitT/TauT family transport system substrate-binding protein